mmetsp:Transcript_36691/g.95024  ORF Transcript_36691/g.95024 Transcript_36691/m.95024 type:complete len:377 (-) Transcript_36691:189-1319(-)
MASLPNANQLSEREIDKLGHEVWGLHHRRRQGREVAERFPALLVAAADGEPLAAQLDDLRVGHRGRDFLQAQPCAPHPAEGRDVRNLDPTLVVHERAKEHILAQVADGEVVLDLRSYLFHERLHRTRSIQAAQASADLWSRGNAEGRRGEGAQAWGAVRRHQPTTRNEDRCLRLQRLAARLLRLRGVAVLGRALLLWHDELGALLAVGGGQGGGRAEVCGELLEALQARITGHQRRGPSALRYTGAGFRLHPLQQRQDVPGRPEVDEGDAARPLCEAATAGQVEEAISVLQSTLGQKVYELRVRDRLADIPDHDGGAQVLVVLDVFFPDLIHGTIFGRDPRGTEVPLLRRRHRGPVLLLEASPPRLPIHGIHLAAH